MRRSLFSLAFILSLISPATTAAADNGTVSAQVTVAAPCITVGDPIDFGTLGFASTSRGVVQGQGNTSYASCSSQQQRIYARGTNAESASSGATWQLANAHCLNAGNALNTYQVFVFGGSNWQQLSLTDQQVSAANPAGETGYLSAEVFMPCSGSDGAGETMTFSIVLTATF